MPTTNDDFLFPDAGRGELGDGLDPLIVAYLREPSSAADELPADAVSAARRLSAADRAALDAARVTLDRRLREAAGTARPQRNNILTGVRATDACSRPSQGGHGDDQVSEPSTVGGCDTPLAIRNPLACTVYESQPSNPFWHDPDPDEQPLRTLQENFERILASRRLPGGRQRSYRLYEQIGKGGQGVVYLTECRGSDGFRFKVAMKVFSPNGYPSARSYERAMRRTAGVISSIAECHHPNVVDVLGFGRRRGIRLMFMGLVDGYDLRVLLSREMSQRVQRIPRKPQYEEIPKVVIVNGPERPRLMPGVAVAILRDCLLGLASLHQLGIVHGDIKPSNIMLDRRTGRPKIVDLGSAFPVHSPPQAIIQTPAYAAVEAIQDGVRTPQSDLASLGYVLIELLAGKRLFSGTLEPEQLLQAKRALPASFANLLPPDVRRAPKLVNFCRRLIEPNPRERFASAQDADLDPDCGASAFLNELAQVRMSAVYDNSIRLWLDALSSNS